MDVNEKGGCTANSLARTNTALETQEVARSQSDNEPPRKHPGNGAGAAHVHREEREGRESARGDGWERHTALPRGDTFPPYTGGSPLCRCVFVL